MRDIPGLISYSVSSSGRPRLFRARLRQFYPLPCRPAPRNPRGPSGDEIPCAFGSPDPPELAPQTLAKHAIPDGDPSHAATALKVLPQTDFPADKSGKERLQSEPIDEPIELEPHP